jgi:hypothetical protein
MTNDELSKIDAQLAMLRMLESNTAMLRTVLHNQMTIMEAMQIAHPDELSALVNARMQESLKIVSEDLKRQVPETFYVKFPKN